MHHAAWLDLVVQERLAILELPVCEDERCCLEALEVLNLLRQFTFERVLLSLDSLHEDVEPSRINGSPNMCYRRRCPKSNKSQSTKATITNPLKRRRETRNQTSHGEDSRIDKSNVHSSWTLSGTETSSTPVPLKHETPIRSSSEEGPNVTRRRLLHR